MFSRNLKNYYHYLEALYANIVNGFPAGDLKVIGITGTDGKTTCTSMIYHILKENGFKVGLISTLHAKVGDELIDTGLHVTTPEPGQLPGILKKFKNRGIKYVVLESTSQGLDQNRLMEIQYDSCLITNIGYDHLDYHKTWENYASAKFKLIKKTRKDGIAVINADHLSFEWIKKKFLQANLPHLITFSKKEAEELKTDITGLHFKYEDQQFNVPLIGDYNLENTLGVIKLCGKYLDHMAIAKALNTFEAPKGRMQMMQSAPFSIIVDFAHTPSSLEKALQAINQIKSKTARIICVFGCAGERDRTRRRMGEISAKLADITLVTLEDSRSENVKDINTEILDRAYETKLKPLARLESHTQYLQKTASLLKQLNAAAKTIISFDYNEVQNRKDAISFALKIGQTDDIVFITGKGHEESLAIGNPAVEHPYTDQETIKELIFKDKVI